MDNTPDDNMDEILDNMLFHAVKNGTPNKDEWEEFMRNLFPQFDMDFDKLSEAEKQALWVGSVLVWREGAMAYYRSTKAKYN